MSKFVSCIAFVFSTLILVVTAHGLTPPTGSFIIERPASGGGTEAAAYFDNNGNFEALGCIHQNSTSLAATTDEELIIKDSGGSVVARLEMSTGDLHLKGTVTLDCGGSGTGCPSPFEPTNPAMIITDDTGTIVSWIDDEGNMVLDGTTTTNFCVTIKVEDNANKDGDVIDFKIDDVTDTSNHDLGGESCASTPLEIERELSVGTHKFTVFCVSDGNGCCPLGLGDCSGVSWDLTTTGLVADALWSASVSTGNSRNTTVTVP